MEDYDDFDSCDLMDIGNGEDSLESLEAETSDISDFSEKPMPDVPEGELSFDNENLLDSETDTNASNVTNQILEVPENDIFVEDAENLIENGKTIDGHGEAYNQILEVSEDGAPIDSVTLPDSSVQGERDAHSQVSEFSKYHDRAGDHLDETKTEDIKDTKNSSMDQKDSANEKMDVDNAGIKAEHLECRNEDLEGLKHPETNVPFERVRVEVDGKQIEVVAPRFDSKYDVQLPEDLLKSPDRTQFKACNAHLKEEAANNQSFRDQFDAEQIAYIESGKTPPGYTWHHDAEVGRMELVDLETHQKTGHTGGRSIWGGGTENRQ